MEKLLSIQQMAQATGISTHTLRYYEQVGLLREINRDEHGYRQYAEKDSQWLLFLLRLRDTGMPIRHMKIFSDLRHEGDATASERRKLLESHQATLEEQIASLQANAASIREKIDYYKKLEIALLED